MQMALTKAMDLRYLWVERLCIIQDDSYHVKNQIQQMASIFANSYFTIIAADGSDANYGLRGIDSESSPRNYKELTFKFSESMQMAPEAELESIRYPKVWHTRDGLSRSVQYLREPLYSLMKLSTGNADVAHGMKAERLSQMVLFHYRTG